MCNPTLLSQRLAGVVENLSLLAPGTCRDLDVHRFDGRRVLCVTVPVSAGWGSLSSQCFLSHRPFAMVVFFEPLPRIWRPRRKLLRRQRVRCWCMPRLRGAATPIVSMAKSRRRKSNVCTPCISTARTRSLSAASRHVLPRLPAEPLLAATRFDATARSHGDHSARRSRRHRVFSVFSQKSDERESKK